MPALRNAWSSVAPVRLSSPGRSWSSISTTVTRLPSSTNTDANSQPMTPPPTTSRLSGMWSTCRISSLVMTRGSPISKTGSRIGSEPLARMTASPSTARAAAAAPGPPPPSSLVTGSTTTRRGPSRRPRPATISTLRCLSMCSTPPRSCSTDACLWAIIAATSRRGGAASSTPNSPPRRASRSLAAVATSAFVGTQPRLRQVPPISRASTSVTSAPSCAARSAAT